MFRLDLVVVAIIRVSLYDGNAHAPELAVGSACAKVRRRFAQNWESRWTAPAPGCLFDTDH